MQKATEPLTSKEPKYPLASVDNALRLLRMFRQQNQIRLSEASEQLGVAHSTAHRLLAMLTYHGFVQQEPRSRSYVAGPALIEVGLAVVGNMDIRTYAHPLLEELAERFDETVHLATLEGTVVRYLDGVESKKAVRVAARTGTALAAHCAAIGKVLLAELSGDQLHERYPPGEPLPGLTPRSIVSLDVLEKELELVRQRGYATNNSESEDGVASVGVAVRDRRGRAIAALSISAPATRIDQDRVEQMAERLLDASKRLTSALPG